MVTEADLHAAVDDQLPPEAMAEIEGWLREQPADAERMAEYRRQNAALHRAYDALLEEPVPAALRATLKSASAGARRPQRHHWYWGAAVAASLVIGTAVGWQLRVVTAGSTASMQFARQAAVAHVVYAPEVRHPVEVGANEEAHLVAWLSKRLGTPLRIPQLTAQGYALVGGRLLPGQADERSLSAPVAQFMYQDARGVRLTLYVRTNPDAARETAFRFAQEKNISVFYWVDQKLGYALSGEMEKNELLRVANAVYKQLNP